MLHLNNNVHVGLCVFPIGFFFSCECYPILTCKCKSTVNEKCITFIHVIHWYISNQQMLSIYNIDTDMVGFALPSHIFMKKHYFPGRKKPLKFVIFVTW